MIVGLAIATENPVTIERDIQIVLDRFGFCWSSGVAKLDFYTDGGFHIFANMGYFDVYGAILDFPDSDERSRSLSSGLAADLDLLQYSSGDAVFPSLINDIVCLCQSSLCRRLAVFFAYDWEPDTPCRWTGGSADGLISLLQLEGGWQIRGVVPEWFAFTGCDSLQSEEYPLIFEIRIESNNTD